MIILDNSVLSSFERLKLLSRLKQLLKSGIISREVYNEYSIQWQKKIPKWIKILQPKEDITLESPPLSLSSADLSLIKLSLEYKVPIATDDRVLREFAKNVGVSVTGSLGLLKSLYQSRLIKTKQEYQMFLDSLQKDIYLSDDLLKWALDES